MAFIGYLPQLGEVNLLDIDPSGPGPYALVGPNAGTFGRASFYNEVMEGEDNAGQLGAGQFVYVQATAALTVGAVVQFTTSQDGNNNMVASVTPWTGTAYSGRGLGVAISPIGAGQWGWVQIGGFAIVNVSGAVAVGQPLYWQANGVVSTTAVAGKHIVGAQSATAAGATLGFGNSATTLAGNKAVVLLNSPVAQGQIT